MTRGIAILCLIAVLLAPGCSTISNATGNSMDTTGAYTVPQFAVYGGTRINAKNFRDGTAGEFFMSFLDFPISLAFDTVMLLFTLPFNIFHEPMDPRGAKSNESSGKYPANKWRH